MPAETPQADPPAPQLHIIAVHGVGSPEPGSLLPGLMQAYSKCQSNRAAFTPRQLTIDGVVYPGVETSEPPGAAGGPRTVAIWDANWADIHRPPEDWPARIPFLLRLLTAIVAYCGKASRFGRPFYCFFLGFLIWLPAFPALSLWRAVLTSGWFLLVAISIVGGMLFVARKVRETDAYAFKAGLFWACVVALLAGWGLFEPSTLAPDAFEPYTRWFLALISGLGPFFLIVFLVFGWSGVPWEVHLSRCALLAVSFAIVTGFIAALLWVNLYFADKLSESPPSLVSAAALDVWDSAYVCSLPYGVAAAEAITTWATLVVGGLLLAALALWAVLTFIFDSRGSGAVLRAALRGITIVVVLVFLAASVFIGFDVAEILLLWGPPDWFVGSRDWLIAFLPWVGKDGVGAVTGSCDANLMEIYGQSALRLLPFVGMLLLKPVRVGLDVTTDILYYLHDPEKPKARFKALLREVMGVADEVAVVGHSQGSRIAVDSVFLAPKLRDIPARLATTGSPVSTLYGVFLGEAKLPKETKGWTWQNYWRGTDFIGGPIQPASKVEGVGPAENPEITDNLELFHLNYWIEAEVMRFLLGASPQRP